jgi:hypothetical protein
MLILLLLILLAVILFLLAIWSLNMAVNLSPVGGVAVQFFTNSGAVLTGGKIFTYAAGTTTPQATYTSASGTTSHSNPIILDASGRVPSGEIWLTDGLVYKFLLKDANDVLIGTYDNIAGINSNFVNFTNQQEIQTATAGQTVFTLATTQYQPGTNSLSVFVDGVNQYGPGAQYAYLETSSTVITFITGLHVGAEVKFTTSQINSSSATDAAQVSYLPAGTGAVATNVQIKLRETVSVKDFGAVGDGVADDTVAINNAVAYLNTLGGGGLFFPAGTYLLSAPINLRSGIDYYGLGWNSIVKQKSGIVATNLFGEATTTSATNSIIIRDLAIDGNRTNVSFPIDDGDGNAIRLNQTSYSRFFNLYIHDTIFNAISVYNSSNDNIISDCQISDIGKVGTPPGAFTFNGVFFEAGSSRNKVVNCRVSATGQYGIWVGARDADNSDNLILGNWVASTFSDGIRVGDDATTNSSNRTQICNNYVIGAGDLGIRVYHTTGGSINQTLISNNHVTLSVIGGIYAQTGAYKTLITANICISNGGYGVAASGEDTTASGNVLLNNVIGQLQLSGTRSVDLWNTTTTTGSPYTLQKVFSGVGFTAVTASGNTASLELDQSGIRKWTMQNTATTGVLDVLFGATTALTVQNAPANGDVGLAVYRNVGGTLSLQQVSMGAADSAGTGYKVLRVAN